MGRALAGTILLWSLLPSVGCDDSQTADKGRSSLLIEHPADAAAPPPPPLLGGPSGSDSVAPAGSPSSDLVQSPDQSGVGKAAELDAKMREFIAVSNQMADEMDNVRTPADAERHAARIQPIVSRQRALTGELAALKFEVPEQEYRPVLARYQARLKTAGERAIRAHAKVFGNLPMMAAWGRGLRAAAGTAAATPAARPSQADLEQKVNAILKAEEELNGSMRQITAALESVQDETSARAAAARLRELTPPMEQQIRKCTALVLRLTSSGDFVRVMQAAAKRGMRDDDGRQMMKTVKGLAGGPYRDLLKPELRGLFEAMLRQAISQPQRESLRRKMRDVGLDR